ncbi:unnamed protein product [Amoebophrya sp. A120]|nr:unnamed protein product [Amoebophrya sp. A120]|eukprot:GSA120T00009589001.1
MPRGPNKNPNPVPSSSSSSAKQTDQKDLERLIKNYHIEDSGLTDFIGVEPQYLEQDQNTANTPGGGTRTRRNSNAFNDDDFGNESSFLEFQRRLAAAGGHHDFFEENRFRRSAEPTQGEMATFLTFVKGFVGIGILSLPYAMSCGGYIGGPVGLTGLAYMAYRCMMKLLEATAIINERIVNDWKMKTVVESYSSPGGVAGATSLQKNDPSPSRNYGVTDEKPPKQPELVRTFGDVGKYIMGKTGKSLINVSIIVTQAGFGIAYLIFIPENIQKVLCYETKQTVCPSTTSITMCVVLFLFPFVFLQNMKTLVIPTLLANFSLLVGIGWGYLNAFGWTPEARMGADEIGEAALPEGDGRSKALVLRRLLFGGQNAAGGSIGFSSTSVPGEQATSASALFSGIQLEGAAATAAAAALPAAAAPAVPIYAIASTGLAILQDLAKRALQLSPAGQKEVANLLINAHDPTKASTAQGHTVAVGFPNFGTPTVTTTTTPRSASSSVSAAEDQTTAAAIPVGPTQQQSATASATTTLTPHAIVENAIQTHVNYTNSLVANMTTAIAELWSTSTLPPPTTTTTSTTHLNPAAAEHLSKKKKDQITKKEKEELEKVRPPSLVAFNFAQYPIFFGIAVFAFEGIGLLLPCQRAMAKPENMPRVVTRCMLFLTILFVSFGLFCYLRWGGAPSVDDGAHGDLSHLRKLFAEMTGGLFTRTAGGDGVVMKKMGDSVLAGPSGVLEDVHYGTASSRALSAAAAVPSSTAAPAMVAAAAAVAMTTTAPPPSPAAVDPSQINAPSSQKTTAASETTAAQVEPQPTHSSSKHPHAEIDTAEETIGVQPMVTFNYPESTITSFVILFYVLGIFFSFPVIMFPVFTLLENSVFIRSQCCLPHRRVIKKIGKKIVDCLFGGEEKFRSWYYSFEDDEDDFLDDDGEGFQFEDEEEFYGEGVSGNAADDDDEMNNNTAGATVIGSMRTRRSRDGNKTVDADTFAIEDEEDDEQDPPEVLGSSSTRKSRSSPAEKDHETSNKRVSTTPESKSLELSEVSLSSTSSNARTPAKKVVLGQLQDDELPDDFHTPNDPNFDKKNHSPAVRLSTMSATSSAFQVEGQSNNATGRRSSRRSSMNANNQVPFLNIYEKCFLRVIVTILSALTASTIPHFGLFLSLLGSITCNLLAFILPAYFHYYMTVSDVMKRRESMRNSSLALPSSGIAGGFGSGGAGGGGGGQQLMSFETTPREDVFYAVFGIIAGLWSFGVTIAEFF